MVIDFNQTARDYGRYRAGFPPRFFDELAARGVGRAPQRMLDLGTGAGTVARGFARRGCRVTGLDPAPALMQEAARLDAEAGVFVPHLRATAEATGLAAHTFDVVTAGQCWHWFDAPRAAREAQRLLVPGGYLVLGHFDWLPLPGNVVEATERLIEEHNPAWHMGGGDGLHPNEFTELATAGFTDLESFTFDEFTPYSHEAWRGRIRASAGVAASLPPAQVARFDSALQRLLAEKFPQDPLGVHHRIFALIARAP